MRIHEVKNSTIVHPFLSPRIPARILARVQGARNHAQMKSGISEKIEVSGVSSNLSSRIGNPMFFSFEKGENLKYSDWSIWFAVDSDWITVRPVSFTPLVNSCGTLIYWLVLLVLQRVCNEHESDVIGAENCTEIFFDTEENDEIFSNQ